MTNPHRNIPILQLTPEAFADNDGLTFVLDIEDVDYWPGPALEGRPDDERLAITFKMVARPMGGYDPERDDPRGRAMFNHMVRSKRETVEAFRSMLDMAWAMMRSERAERRAG